jgi:hypothetical protein
MFMPIEFEFDSRGDDDSAETLGWLDVFLETIADAAALLAQVQP